MIGEFFNKAFDAGKAILVWAIIICAVPYIAGTIYVNYFQHNPDAPVEPPSVSKAEYQILIGGTGQVLYSDKVNDNGQIVTLYNYYELRDDGYVYKKTTVPLDRRTFGEIEVRKR